MPTIDHPTWLYSGQDAKLFDAGDEHPGEGWADAPGPTPEPLPEAVKGEPAAGLAVLIAENDALTAENATLRAEVDELKTKLAEAEKPSETVDPDAVEAEKVEIRAELAELGQPKPSHLTGLPKLRALLAAAKGA